MHAKASQVFEKGNDGDKSFTYLMFSLHLCRFRNTEA